MHVINKLIREIFGIKMYDVGHFWNEKFDKHLTLFYISVDYCTSLLLLVI